VNLAQSAWVHWAKARYRNQHTIWYYRFELLTCYPSPRDAGSAPVAVHCFVRGGVALKKQDLDQERSGPAARFPH
jgi:hypothetical protein